MTTTEPSPRTPSTLLSTFIDTVVTRYGPDVRTVTKLIEYDDSRPNRFHDLTLKGRDGETLGTTSDPDLTGAFTELYAAQTRPPHTVYLTFTVDLNTAQCTLHAPACLHVLTPIAIPSDYDYAPTVIRRF